MADLANSRLFQVEATVQFRIDIELKQLKLSLLKEEIFELARRWSVVAKLVYIRTPPHMSEVRILQKSYRPEHVKTDITAFCRALRQLFHVRASWAGEVYELGAGARFYGQVPEPQQLSISA